MAPLIKTAFQLLLGSLSSKGPETGRRIPKLCTGGNEHVVAYDAGGLPSLSAVSWGPDRLDIFGVDKSTGSLSHKWWDGNQWKPSGADMELLGGRFYGPPTAVSRRENTIDIFAVDPDFEELRHKSFDGSQWHPGPLTWNNLSGTGLLESTTALSITSRAPGWLDIFAHGSSQEDEFPTWHLRHKYHNGSDWSEWIDLQGSLQSSPIAISPDLNTLEVVTLGNDDINVLEANRWDGSKWSGWSETSTRIVTSDSDSTLTSSGGGLFDVFTVGPEGTLFHAHDAYGVVEEEDVGGYEARGFSGKPAVIGGQGDEDSPPKRIDVVVLGDDLQYHHVSGSGIDKWANWSCHGGKFSSAPAIVSWGNDAAQRLDIFGITTDGQLAHQAWLGDDWYPASDKWEIIGGNLKVFSPGSTESAHRDL